MTGYELLVYNLDLQSRAERLGTLAPEELRRRGLEAARDRDAKGLWALTESYLVLRGARGARVSSNTLSTYRFGLDALLTYAAQAGMSLLRPRPNEAHAYVRWLETRGRGGKGLAPASVKNRLAAARCLYAALRWSGATPEAPFTDVRAASDPVPRHQKRHPYPEADLQLLLGRGDPQDRVIILLGAHAGLRVSEMLSLRRADLQLEARGPYLTVTGKRQKRQDVPVSRSLLEALTHWLGMTPMLGERVLSYGSRQSVEDRLCTLCGEVGVRYAKRAVHGLRHSAGTRVYSETKDLLEVRDHLRHRDITSSEIYVEYARQDRPSVNREW